MQVAYKLDDKYFVKDDRFRFQPVSDVAGFTVIDCGKSQKVPRKPGRKSQSYFRAPNQCTCAGLDHSVFIRAHSWACGNNRHSVERWYCNKHQALRFIAKRRPR